MLSRPSSSHSQTVSEQTPLLAGQDEERSNRQGSGLASPVAESLKSITSPKRQQRWVTIATLLILSLMVLAILGLGFAAPAAMEEYAKEALVIEPENLSIDSFTVKGVRARIQAGFYLDASKVPNKSIRDLGRASTWIAKEIESGESEVKVFLPEYGNVLLGTAKVPPVKVNIQDGHYNHVDFLIDLEPGDVEGIRRVANDWLDGRLGSLRVKSIATIPLKTGFINLGKQTISKEMFFTGDRVPAFPNFNIEKLKFEEYGPPGKPEGMKAVAAVLLMNEYPVNFDVPPLSFDVLLPDCFEEFLTLGEARTEIAHILPKQYVNVNVTGMIRQLPASLTTACPGSNKSPLDSILGSYLKGKKTTIYVRGGDQDEKTPDWITGLLRGTTVPLPLPGHPFDNLIKNFSLANVHFSLPDPMAEPNTPEAQPKISAIVKALVGLPDEMNFNLDVDRVRADADVFYLGDKMGKLDLREWQTARTTIEGKDLLIESDIDNAPLEITDNDIFTKVIQELIFGKGVNLSIRAKVDVNTVTALGKFIVRRIPANGTIFVNPIGSGFGTPEVGDLKILETTKKTITLSAMVNVTNPTEYSAHVPYVNISISHNDTAIGYASAETDVVPGMNSIMVIAVFETNAVGMELLSQILSGWNTTLTFKTHAGTIPMQPELGKALSGFEVVVNTPKLFGTFIKDATVCD
jgi:Protein of unknown function (DUF3712)